MGEFDGAGSGVVLPDDDFDFVATARAYDVIYCDIWGVLHNGREPYERAVEALIAARDALKIPVILITNSPRLKRGVVEQLRAVGVREECFDDVVTSGDMVRGWLEANQSTPVFWLGPERDARVFDGLEMTLVPLEEADAVFCTGLLDDEREGVEDYRQLLSRALARNLPFVSANPDEVAHRGETLITCAGALARAYEEMGGIALAYGKPHRVIYDRALALAQPFLANRQRDCALAIGDNFKTDIVGALNAGADAMFVTSGIHRGEQITPVLQAAEQLSGSGYGRLIACRTHLGL